MIVELGSRWEIFVQDLVASGRFSGASDAVDAALREMKEREHEQYPPGSLAHLYTPADTEEEDRLASCLSIPSPDSV